MEHSRKILLSAFIGGENLGDEAIFLTVAEKLISKVRGISVVAASVNPAKSRRLLSSQSGKWSSKIEIRHRWWLPIEIFRSNICVFGGGGIIQDQSSVLNLIYFLAQIQFAKLLQKTSVLAYVGIGPIHSRIGRAWARVALSGLSLCIVRDSHSRQLLEDLGVSNSEVVSCSDIALNLNCRSSGKYLESTSDGYVLLALRHWFGTSSTLVPASLKPRTIKRGSQLDAFLNKVARELNGFFETNQATYVIAVPFFGSRDVIVHQVLRGKIKEIHRARFRLNREISDPCEYVKLAKSAMCVVGMRLHSLVLAARESVPLIALSYSDKVSSFMAQLDLQSHVIDTSTTAEAVDLSTMLSSTIENEQLYRDKIKAQVLVLQNGNEAAFSKLVTVIENA